MNAAETFKVRARVLAVIPEYHQAIAQSAEGLWHHITRHTQGVSIEDVREGQVYLLTVTCRPSRVLHAQLIDPEQIVGGAFPKCRA